LDKLKRDTKWGKTVTNLVDWQGIKKAQDQYLKPARVKYTKMMFNLNQTNSQNNDFMAHHRVNVAIGKLRLSVTS
jgi:hypothetical protein